MDEVIVLTGAPGAGKTSVAEALSSLLEDAGIEHAALEAEQLCWGHPWLDPEVVRPALLAVLAELRRAGRRRLVLIDTAETEAELRSLVGAAGGALTVVAAVRVPPELAATRIREREPEWWAGREALAAHAHELATVIPDLPAVDVVLDTEGRLAIDVARELLAAAQARGFGAQAAR